MDDRLPNQSLALEEQGLDIVLRMLCVGEARGEQDASGHLEAVAMLGPLWTLKNRQASGVRRWAGLGLDRLALQPMQYSCFNRDDPNRAMLMTAWRRWPEAWERADTVVDLFLSGFTTDPTNGATHYVVATLNGSPLWDCDDSRKTQPRWHSRQEIDAGRTVFRARIGSHVFATAP